MDPYLALIAGTPTDSSNQQLLAKGLRRDADFGALGMVSGDAALSPFGKMLLNRSNTNATTLGTNRMAQNKQRALQKYYDTMEGFRESQAKTAADRLSLDQKRADEIARHNKVMEEAALMRALNAGRSSGKSQRMRYSDIKMLYQQGNVTKALGDLLEQAKDPNLKVGKMALPGMRTVGNFLAQYGYGDKNSKAAQDWWANYDKFYTLEMRNLLFGATLTPNEQRAWAGANISPEMDDQQIQQKLTNLFNVLQERKARIANVYVDEGYNPQSIETLTGVDVTPDQSSADQGDQGGQGDVIHTPENGYGPLYGEGGGNTPLIPNLDNMSLEELMQLQKQYEDMNAGQ